MMNPTDQRKIYVLLVVFLPTLFWLTMVQNTEILTQPKWKSLWYLACYTHEKPLLFLALLAGLAFLLIWMIHTLNRQEFEGASFKTFLRGTRIVSGDKLKRLTWQKYEQITLAGIPMPLELENLHLLISGSTGSGKSVLMRELVYKALLRGDRMIIADPDSDMLSKFFQPNDMILNPYDQRTQGWSIFNEIRH